MKDITIDNPFEDEDLEVTPSEEVKEEVKKKEVLEPKDNTMTIVLLILLTVVVGLIVWYKTKGDKNE